MAIPTNKQIRSKYLPENLNSLEDSISFLSNLMRKDIKKSYNLYTTQISETNNINQCRLTFERFVD